MAVVISTSAISQDTYQVKIYPEAGEAFAHAEYTLWVPEGLDEVQRIILHQHGCGENAQIAGQTVTDDLHWKLLAEKTNAALLGSSLWPQNECVDWCDPNNGTERAYLQALNELANLSSHAEVAEVNWVIWGHSGGGFWTQSMLQKYPERFEAAVLQSAGFRRRENRDTALQSVSYATNVPVLIHVGIEEKGHERFNGLYEDGVRTFALMREKEAPVTLIIDPATGHGSGNTRYLTIPWIAAVLEQKEETEVIWPTEHSEQGNWFPSQIIAAKGEVFSELGNVPDFTHPKQAPGKLQAEKAAQGVKLTWEATPDWESGVKTFRIYRNGKLLPPYTAPAREEGKLTEYYREPKYSDTPGRPLANMEYIDTNAPSGEAHRYQVSLVNWSGLESPKSQAIEVDYQTVSKGQ
ncbi:hypothetical protein [Tunicatimonas sp.]|uniref:alpha/beta hydrolase family protein n=1 Tax=Tunicatimonas sp. TaxID=1940096 RepID=UPI003C76967E